MPRSSLPHDTGTPPDTRLAAFWVVARTLMIGGAGGALFAWFELPLAWMMGAMLATTVSALAGARLKVSPQLRELMIIVLGVVLGSTFTPELLDQLGVWGVTMAGVAAYVGTAFVIGAWFLRRFAGYDPVTAYFTAAPGGLSEMVLMGGSLGGDDRTIALSHSARILFVVMVIPFALRLVTGDDLSAPADTLADVAPLRPLDALVLVFCAVGVPVGMLLRLPAPSLMGPLLVSAGLHIAGLTSAMPPAILVMAAQVVLGSAVGTRFAGLELRHAAHALAVAAGLSVLLLILTAVFAVGLHLLTGLGMSELVLAITPGGVAEMSLIALAMGLDPAFVSAHHLGRLVIVLAVAPVLFRLFKPREGP